MCVSRCRCRMLFRNNLKTSICGTSPFWESYGLGARSCSIEGSELCAFLLTALLCSCHTHSKLLRDTSRQDGRRRQSPVSNSKTAIAETRANTITFAATPSTSGRRQEDGMLSPLIGRPTQQSWASSSLASQQWPSNTVQTMSTGHECRRRAASFPADSTFSRSQ